MYISDTKIHWWILQETYTIVDAFKYLPTEYTSNTNVNIPLPNGNFEITTKIKPTSRSGAYIYYNIGQDSNHRIYWGQGNPNGSCTLYVRNSSSGAEYNQSTTGKTDLNEWNDCKLSYVDGLWTLTFGNETLSHSNSNSTLRGKIYEIGANSGSIKDLIIKSL